MCASQICFASWNKQDFDDQNKKKGDPKNFVSCELLTFKIFVYKKCSLFLKLSD